MEPYELLEKVLTVLERLQIRYLVKGSVASMAYGEPRLTNDIDVVAAVMEQHVAPLLAAFPPEEFYKRGICPFKHQGLSNNEIFYFKILAVRPCRARSH